MLQDPRDTTLPSRLKEYLEKRTKALPDEPSAAVFMPACDLAAILGLAWHAIEDANPKHDDMRAAIRTVVERARAECDRYKAAFDCDNPAPGVTCECVRCPMRTVAELVPYADE